MSRPIILCIDDEDLGLEIRKMVLEREGFTVLTARDGATGISVFDHEQVDAVVLDYAMPGMDGGQVAAILRQRRPDLPILMLSAYVALPDDVMRVVSVSATKGDGAFTLVDKLKELLQSNAPDATRRWALNLHQFRHILIITVLLPLVLLLLLALVLAWQIQRTLREQRRIDHTDRITAQLNELERLVVDQETGLRGYQLTRDPTTLEPYQDAEGALHQTLDRLLLLVREDPDQLRRLRQIRDSHELWIGFAGKALDNLRAGKIFGDTGLDLTGAQLMAALRTQLGAMTKVEVKRRDQEVQSTNSQVRTLMMVLLASSIGVGIVLGIFTYRNMKQVSAAFRGSLEEAHQRADELS